MWMKTMNCGGISTKSKREQVPCKSLQQALRVQKSPVAVNAKKQNTETI
jgi:hypothetical protein